MLRREQVRLDPRLASGGAAAAALVLLLGARTVAPAGAPVVASSATAVAEHRASDDEAERVGRSAARILRARCEECHGPDRVEGELRLDSREALLRGGDTGTGAVAGDPDASEIYLRVTSDFAFDRMPYEQTPLSDDEIATLRRWIELGMPWPESGAAHDVHWSYEPIVRPSPPEAEHADLVRSPIDAFVLARLEQAGIEPSPEADPRTLVRRLYLDLWGLLPEPEVVEAFAADPSDAAYDALVDRLLASQHFAERFARHWLDRARYADSDGYEKDEARTNAWHYRDWVIDAIDRDLPWDRFTIEQIAGDLVPDADWRTRLGTAFNRQTLTNREGGVDQEEFRVQAVMDRVATVGTTWLGMTYGCAQCHDHKYEAISQREYYGLFAFFDNADEVDEPLRPNAYELAHWHDERDPRLEEREALLAEIEAARRDVPDDVSSWIPAERTRLERAFDGIARAWVRNVRAESDAVPLRVLPNGTVATAPPKTDAADVVVTISGPRRISGVALRFLADDEAGTLLRLSEVEAKVRSAGRERSIGLSNARSDQPRAVDEVEGAIDGIDETRFTLAPTQSEPVDLCIWSRRSVEIAADEVLELTLRTIDPDREGIGAFRVGLLTEPDPIGAPDDAYRLLVRPPSSSYDERQLEVLRRWREDSDPKVRALLDRLAQLERDDPAMRPFTAPVLEERREDRRDTRLMERGDFLRPAERVEPSVLAILPPLVVRDPERGPDRLDLANWIVAPENPLPLRVAANQIWQRLFGRGIVSTPEDFGNRGEAPSHPRLLDWLATEYRRVGLSRKAMVREIVRSSTYRRSSVHRDDLRESDPENKLLARQNRRRVEAETVRDATLGAAGLLSLDVGGPSVFPPMDPSVTAQSYAFTFDWTTSEGADRYRRGMYTFFKRTAPHPNLVAFDCPAANVTAPGRKTSNTPIQALVTLNDEVYVEAACAFADRVLDECGADVDDAVRVERAFELALGRAPRPSETEVLLAVLADARAHFADASDDVEALLPATLSARLPQEPAERAETAAWAATLRVVLNLDEFLTRE
ncbi:MAG: PSD1 and planctomycete cytochrome C domain-containing protein [Planctomycetota bacterium]